MIKLKNLKILLLLLLFTISQQYAWAGGTDYWYFSNAKVETRPTGAGKVYAGNQNAAANPTNCVDAPHVFDGKTHKSQLPYQWYVNTIPTDSRQFKFLRWEDANGNVLSTDQNPQNPFTDSEGVKGGGNNTGKSGDGATNPGTVTVNYIAVYEEIINQYVSVESQNSEYLTATIDKPENTIGEEVTLWAYPNNYNSKFTGWTKDGEIVSMENPWTFTIDESNAGTYIANYKTDYNFYRFNNKETSRRFNAISDLGSITNFSALQLVSGEVATYSAGSVVQISKHHISGGDVYEYAMQNANTSTYYNESAGEYITMALNSSDNTWSIHPNRQPLYLADENGASVSSSPYDDLDKSKWYIEPIDKDLETCENYFSLDPAKLVQVGNDYYTTLRTSWNILFNPEQMTPYVVTSVDETDGTFEMEALTGNIIPAGTPVIIKTKSNDIEENRMVPTKTAAASGAVPTGNLLQSSTKYFPNQTNSSNLKPLTVNAAGQLAFSTTAPNTINGNEAYLNVAAILKPEIPQTTLASLLASGDTQNTYEIIELTAVLMVDNDRLVICKDNNEYALPNINSNENAIDYMLDESKLQNTEYDQSNWVGLRLPDGQEATVNNVQIGKTLTRVIGRLINTTNPEIELKVLPLVGTTSNYSSNVFIPASFRGTQTSTENNKTYFFVEPKPMEVSTIEWAQWDGQKFISIPKTEDQQTGKVVNAAGLTGEFDFNGAYLTNGGSNTGVDISSLKTGYVYKLDPAVVRTNATAGESNHVYVLGNVNGLSTDGTWSPAKGVEMYSTDGNTFTTTLTVDKASNNDNNGYFGFTKKLDANWDNIAAYRFGAVSNGNFAVNSQTLNQWCDLTYNNYQSYEAPNGQYTITVKLSEMKIKISNNAGASSAPRLRSNTAANGYTVYPISITEQGSVVGNVITGVNEVSKKPEVVSVTYYDATGRMSKRPFTGINIIVTRYSDGSCSTTKQVMKN